MAAEQQQPASEQVKQVLEPMQQEPGSDPQAAPAAPVPMLPPPPLPSALRGEELLHAAADLVLAWCGMLGKGTLGRTAAAVRCSGAGLAAAVLLCSCARGAALLLARGGAILLDDVLTMPSVGRAWLGVARVGAQRLTCLVMAVHTSKLRPVRGVAVPGGRPWHACSVDSHSQPSLPWPPLRAGATLLCAPRRHRLPAHRAQLRHAGRRCAAGVVGPTTGHHLAAAAPARPGRRGGATCPHRRRCWGTSSRGGRTRRCVRFQLARRGCQGASTRRRGSGCRGDGPGAVSRSLALLIGRGARA